MRFGAWLHRQIDGEPAGETGDGANPSPPKPKADGLAGALNVKMPNIDVSPN